MATKKEENIELDPNTRLEERKRAEAKAEGPSRIDDPARTEAPTGARVSIPAKEFAAAGAETESEPVGSPAVKGKTYTYVVKERAFKENILLDPEKMGEDNPLRLFQSAEIYVSRALEPYDDVTKKAVEKRRKEHDEHYGRGAPISQAEAQELRARLRQLEERDPAFRERNKESTKKS